MKKFATLLILLATCLSAGAAEPFRAFAEKVATSRVTFAYSYESVREGVKFKGDGTAAVQGDAFRMEGNGLDILSDGQTRWTADAEAMELIVEPVDSEATDFISNPALLVSGAAKAFNVKSTGTATFKGQSVQTCVLAPKKACGIKELSLYFSGETLSGVTVWLTDGTKTDFVISNLAFSEPGSLDGFRYDKQVGKDWIVTDLR